MMLQLVADKQCRAYRLALAAQAERCSPFENNDGQMLQSMLALQ